MNGHWQSNTRKLNKHYQSGNGGKGYQTYFIDAGLVHLSGFQEAETDILHGTFTRASNSNVICAPAYRLFDTTPSPTSISTHLLSYSTNWSGRGYEWTPGQYSDLYEADDLPLWKYDNVTGTPLWWYSNRDGQYDAYSQTMPSPMKAIRWWGGTIDDVTVNVYGLSSPVTNPYLTTLPNAYTIPATGSYISLEDAYQNQPVNILIPVFRMIAVPYIGPNNVYTKMDMRVSLISAFTDDAHTHPLRRRNLVKVKDLPAGMHPVWDTNWTYGEIGYDGDDKTYYVGQGEPVLGTYNARPAERSRVFCDRDVYFFTDIKVGETVVEGQTRDMLIALCFDHFEYMAGIDVSQYVENVGIYRAAFGYS